MKEVIDMIVRVFEILAMQRRPIPFMRLARENEIKISDMYTALHWLLARPEYGITVNKKNGYKFLSIDDQNDLTISQVKRMITKDIERATKWKM